MKKNKEKMERIKMTNEKEREILRFLIDGKAYSDSAIMKNFGIDEEELKEVYSNLLSQGYLEPYKSYEERQGKKRESMKENHCGTGCSSCGGEKTCGSQHDHNNNDENSGCCGEQDLDKDKILVLTEKALKA